MKTATVRMKKHLNRLALMLYSIKSDKSNSNSTYKCRTQFLRHLIQIRIYKILNKKTKKNSFGN